MKSTKSREAGSRFAGKYLLSLFAAILVIAAGYGLAHALPYAPGQTLDPTCNPGDANCTVRGVVIDNGTVAGANATSSTVSFNIQGSGTMNPFNIASSTGTSLLTVLANGNVGIGTTTPSSSLAISTMGSPANVPFSIIGDTSQSADIFDLYKGSTLLGLMDNGGSMRIAGRYQLSEPGTSNVVQALYVESGTNNLLLRAGPTANRITIKTSSLINIAQFDGATQSFSLGSSYAATAGPANGMIVQGNVGISTTTPVANFQVANGTNATTTVEFGSGGQNKGTCIKLYRSDGSAIYASVAAGATTFTLSTTACASVSGF